MRRIDQIWASLLLFCHLFVRLMTAVLVFICSVWLEKNQPILGIPLTFLPSLWHRLMTAVWVFICSVWCEKNLLIRGFPAELTIIRKCIMVTVPCHPTQIGCSYMTCQPRGPWKTYTQYIQIISMTIISCKNKCMKGIKEIALTWCNPKPSQNILTVLLLSQEDMYQSFVT